MSLIIFFGMASAIFIAGIIAISVTLVHWKKEKKIKLQTNTQAKKQET